MCGIKRSKNDSFFRVKGGRYFIILGTLVFFSCGIEEYIYLFPVSDVSVQGVNSITITSPDQSSVASYFDRYLIFYRIYLSDKNLSSASSYSDLSNINSAMASHYSYFSSYTSTANYSVVSYNMSDIFNQKGFYELSVTDSSINLTSDSPVTFTLTLNSGTRYQNRKFTKSDINKNGHDDEDVEGDTTTTGQYAYVMFYIIAFGTDTGGSAIYSNPTWLGVLKIEDN
ncbi:MAG: hypothetical protein N2Z76_02900 [Treponemataceae bacterium]|nr:hypothetical protein [Treponemataceae bacterium]